MGKKYSVFLCVLFCGVLLAFFAAQLIVPDKEFSPNENRYLQQKPELTAESFQLRFPLEESGDFFTGKFMSIFETYVTDQFPGRDGWISTKSLSEKIMGKRENNGVYFGTDNQTLISRFDEPDPDRVVRNLDYVNKLVEKVDIPVYFSLIPGKEAVWSDLLPRFAPNADTAALLEQAQGHTTAQWIDVNTVLTAHADEDIFYRTDHHWTSLGAYYGYTALMEGMGITPVALDAYTPTTVSTEFYGTAYSTSGVRWVDPDTIEIYVPEEGLTVTSYREADATGNPVPSEGQLYDESYLEVKDKYSYFLGGQQPLCVIDTGVEGPRLMVVRDSFSDSLAPFLTAHFSQIHLVDPRYYKASLSNYAQTNEIDQILVLYSVSNFVTETNLFVLGM